MAAFFSLEFLITKSTCFPSLHPLACSFLLLVLLPLGVYLFGQAAGVSSFTPAVPPLTWSRVSVARPYHSTRHAVRGLDVVTTRVTSAGARRKPPLNSVISGLAGLPVWDCNQLEPCSPCRLHVVKRRRQPGWDLLLWVLPAPQSGNITGLFPFPVFLHVVKRRRQPGNES